MMKCVLSFAVVLAGAAACTFPGFYYDTVPSDGGAECGGDAQGQDGRVDRESGAPPASSADATPEEADAAFEAGDPCDQDEDGFIAKACGGNDCCDTDKRANIEQTGFFSYADACGSFDWNCDGQATPKYLADLACPLDVWGLGCFTSCEGGAKCTAGFIGAAPDCGFVGPYGECEQDPIPIACQPTQTLLQTQMCH
jgi:hypothetical protein